MRMLVYGSKSFAATVAELARHCAIAIEGFVDDFGEGPNILGNFEELRRSHPPDKFVYGLGIGYSDLLARWQAWQRIVAAGYQTPALVHPRAYVADTAQVGQGCLVMAGSVVDIRAKLGEVVVLWPQACINHDADIGANCFISPGAIVCGVARLGPNCFIGAGAAIADHCDVPEASFVKMQSRYTGHRRTAPQSGTHRK